MMMETAVTKSNFVHPSTIIIHVSFRYKQYRLYIEEDKYYENNVLA